MVEHQSPELSYTFHIEAFGCPTSQYEGEAVRSALQKEGFQEASGRPADIYIINTCVVTEAAARKARKAARRARKENPEALIILMGCYPQVYPEEVSSLLPEADLILGNEGRAKLPDLIRWRLKEKEAPPWNLVKDSLPAEPLEELPPIEIPCGKIRPVLKIQEGCDEFCRYCIVARARGKPRSLSPPKVLEQAERFLERGCREIVLTGTHIGVYGKDLEGWNLAKIIRQLANLPYDFRIRLSSVEPVSVTEELLQTMSGVEKVCPYLYLPLQSGSDRVLKLMGRRYTSGNFEAIVSRARELMPDISIYADIIVGFPGERGEDHRQTMALVQRLELSGLHVFSYSPRPRTPAYYFKERVRPDITKRRYREMKALHWQLALRFHQKMNGKRLRVLVERVKRDRGEGFSDNYVRVKFNTSSRRGEKEDIEGRFITVSPKKFFAWGIEGEEIHPLR